jgi:Uncharacterized conserved protein
LPGISHFYFVSIHPFEDGNRRIARAIEEKAISHGLRQPVIEKTRLLDRLRGQINDRQEKALLRMLREGLRDDHRRVPGHDDARSRGLG